LRHSVGREDLVQHDPNGFGYGRYRCSRILSIRPLYLDGEAISAAPLPERKERFRDLLSNAGARFQYSDHQVGRGPEFYAKACELCLEGGISKRADAPYAPGDRGLWVKV